MRIHSTVLDFGLTATSLSALPSNVHEVIREFGGDPEDFQVSITAKKLGVSEVWHVTVNAQSTEPLLWPPQDAPS